ncbi:polysaccharide biosynthesis protein [Marinicauda salina]|uniref:Polysaccharide biosynthesis protein n=1 Tax=Marinicauda salina TaxID=2135793 RepID=A0A2U2BVY6_9PROT|nr:polysaccharide biosynthesis protein [Marinicauda salina]PWE18160.1 polysaccharide biosynthesis protein [Marinicauda salina]
MNKDANGQRYAASSAFLRWLTRRAGPAAILTYDAVAGAAAMFFSVVARYLFEPGGVAPGAVEWTAAGLFLPVCIVTFFIAGLHRGLWRHTSINDVGRIVQAVVAAHLVFLPIFFLATRLADFPRSSFLISAPVLLVLMLAPRLAVSAWRSGDLRALLRLENQSAPLAVLVGSEARLAEVLREQFRRSGGPVFRARALIELNSDYAGRALLGVPVAGGLEALEDAVRRLSRGAAQPVRIVITDPDPTAELIDLCARVAGRTGAALTRAKSADGARAFTQVEAADLLARPPRALSRDGARALVTGKRVLVTGAGGAIGSELTRQVAHLSPERLILLDSAESHLYEIDMELASWAGSPFRRPVLGDVRDPECLAAVFEREKPDVILHAAALKHVPLMEANASEAALTNVFGLENVVEAAAAAGSEVVVFISTDKAVDPAGVMGATKRAAELYLSAARDIHPELRLSAVRFGNVLASTGSVVPLFERQIAGGGPVTVTHREATRYFMTVQEAAGLVLEAGARTAGDPSGGLFLLDMGEPVPIARLARQLIRLRGMEPGRDIRIEETGLRPGEKLHETLVHAFETTTPSDTAGVLQVAGPACPMAALGPALDRLRAAAEARDEEAVREALLEVVKLGWPEGVRPIASRLSAAGEA